MTEPIKLPKTDKKLGSCPYCGTPIWESYFIEMRSMGKIYRCLGCKGLILKEAIIPF